jgi:hypothetical protein
MDNKLFDTWTDQLLDKSYDWKQIGISNDHCNEISEPEFGVKLTNWPDRLFEVVDEHKYTIFLLRFR